MSPFCLRFVVAACVGGLLATAVMMGASAGHLDIADGEDTKGLLDIRRVKHSGGERPRWKVMTYDGWTKKRIFDAGYVTVLLDTKGKRRPDYYVLVGSFGTRLYGHLWRDRASRPDYKVSRIKVSKPNWKTIAIKVPLAKMKVGSRRLVYRWQVETLFTGARCPSVCFDLAPDGEPVTEPLPHPVEPSPIPSVTPTPVPSGTVTPGPSATPTPSPSS